MSAAQQQAIQPWIAGLHHLAMRCKDSETTRQFYEDFLGLPLAAALEIGTTKTGRMAHCMHTFYRMADGSFLAFFEAPDMQFDFKTQHDFDLHVALEVPRENMLAIRDKALALGMECRGVSDHVFVESIYLRDPNGYVVELTTPTSTHDSDVDPNLNHARDNLKRWTSAK